MKMSISEAIHILSNYMPAVPNSNARYASAVACYALSQDLDYPWHPCSYDDNKLEHDGYWEDGRWYEWLDKYNNREVARMKRDAVDHFYPNTKIVKEENVIAFREIRYTSVE